MTAIDLILGDPELNCLPIGDHSPEQAADYMIDTAREPWELAYIGPGGTTLVRDYGYDIPGKTGAFFKHLNTGQHVITALAFGLLNPNLDPEVLEQLLEHNTGIVVTNLHTDQPSLECVN